MTGPIRAVVFDVGETLVDESRAWAQLAEHAGLTPLTLMGALGAVIERGADHREVWDVVGIDPPTDLPAIESVDLYADALPCLRAVRAAGLVVGIAGNQPEAAQQQLRQAGFEAEFIASSAAWGVAKPSSAFFERVVEAAGEPASSILYVGDRVDNDVVAARSAGLRTAFIRRGPWGVIHAHWPDAALADARIESLAELLPAIERMNA